MFNVGGGEILVILLVALLVLGPDKLPGAARSAGKVMRQVRGIAQGFQDEVRAAINEDDATGTSNRPARPALPRTDLHPGAGAGPSLPAADPAGGAVPEAPPAGAADDAAAGERATSADDAGWRAEGPSGSFS